MDNNADDLALVEKTIEAIKDMATSITANSAIGPKPDPEQVAGTTNEQMLLGDAAIAPEAVPAPIAPKKTAKKRRAAPKKWAKQVARPTAKTPKKTVKKAAKNFAKKSSKKSAKKTKSSAGRTAKKVTKKKKAKKSKR
jgi:hypothetical protein